MSSAARSRRSIFAFVAIAAVAAALAGPFLAVFAPNSYRQEMGPVYRTIAAGEQGWGDRAREHLDGIIARSADRHGLAGRLMQESDGSLVAEGMILAVQLRHPRRRHLVAQHLGDRRWNWYLADNNALAEQLLPHVDGKQIEHWVASRISELDGRDSVRRPGS